MGENVLTIFVIMPFSQCGIRDGRLHRKQYWDNLFSMIKDGITIKYGAQIRQLFNVESISVTRAETPQGNMVDFIIRHLIECDIVVSVLTDANPNVLYELGLRHCLSRGHCIMLIQEDQKIPFDFSIFGVGKYPDSGNKRQVIEKELLKRLTEIAKGDDRADNPVVDFEKKGGHREARDVESVLHGKGLRVTVPLVEDNDIRKSHPMYFVGTLAKWENRDADPSMLFCCEIEVLNLNQEPVAVDDAKLMVNCRGHRLETHEVYEGDVRTARAMVSLHASYKKRYRLDAADRMRRKVCFVFREVVEMGQYGDAIGRIEIMDAAGRSFQSNEVRFIPYLG